MSEKLEEVKRKADTGLQLKDPRHLKQLLREICFIAAEYIRFKALQK